MMGGIGLGILEMTYVSYFLTIIAVLSGIVTVILFFVYDIRRCLRIVRGGQACASLADIAVNRKKEHGGKPIRHDRTQKLAPAEKTEPLCPDENEATVLLTEEEIKPLETMYLVQDITMMEAQS